MSASETTAMPIAPATSSGRSPSSTRGIVNGGRPLGSTPTRLTPRRCEVQGHRQHHRGDDRHQHGRHLRQEAAEDHHHGDAEQPDADRRGHGLARRHALHERLRLGDEPVRVGREAEQLRQLADEDREGEAVHVADLRRLGQQVRDEPEAGARADEHERAHHQREHRRVRDGGVRVAVGGARAAGPSRRSSSRARSPGRGRGSATARRPRRRPGTGRTCTGR